MTKWRPAAFGIVLATVPLSALAEFRPDLRVKLGGAAGIEKIELGNIVTGSATQQAGGNFQVEMVMTQKNESGAGLVGSVGVFGRQHSGRVTDPVFPGPTDIDYDAAGVSGSIGVSFKANDNLHFEGRFELGIGSGEPTLTTPGFLWNPVREGAYSSTSFMFGGYFTITKTSNTDRS